MYGMHVDVPCMQRNIMRAWWSALEDWLMMLMGTNSRMPSMLGPIRQSRRYCGEGQGATFCDDDTGFVVSLPILN